MGLGHQLLEQISQRIDRNLFQQEHWQGSFEEYLEIVLQNPRVTRAAYERLYDMVLSYGTYSVEGAKDGQFRYKFFDDPDHEGRDAIFGLTKALMELVNVFKSAALKYGSERRVLLLHGPVGSSKSTIARLLKRGLEKYSQTATLNNSAAQLLLTAGDNPDRLRSEASFAALCGVSPVPASSGKTVRHRLNRGGDRAANSAIHIIAIGRLRLDSRTQDYVAKRIGGAFPILYTGANGLVAHECIADLRPLTKATGVTVDDVAKRLIDYGFHAPTMSFPVSGTLMIEPTESESATELDRFCDAMIAIRAEADAVAAGQWPADDNPLHNAPHTQNRLVADHWPHPYPRRLAAYPGGLVLGSIGTGANNKYWPASARIDGVYGDRNLVCSCPPIDSYAE